jgi:hypothetical protein
VAADAAEDQLAWEAKHRRGAAIAAALAALLILVGSAWLYLIRADEPKAGLIGELGRLAEPGTIGDQPSLGVELFEYNDDRAATIMAAVAMIGLGMVALGWALTYLAVATRARRPALPRALLYLPLIGGVLNGVYVVASELSRLRSFDELLSGPRTVDAVRDLDADGFAVFAAIIGLPGVLGLALALVFVALNAMRVGLLTRFMGTLGIISGVLLVLPLIVLPVVLTFWLAIVSMQLFGFGQDLPAWRTGEAHPWPTSAEIREQRQRAAAEARGEAWDPPQPEPVAAAGPAPGPAARKRKRKRR